MSNQSKHLILIDDDSDLLEIMSHILGAFKIKITSFKQAQIAFEWLEENKNDCDFILCDVNMPKISGLELAQKVIAAGFLPQEKIRLISVDTGLNDNPIYKEAGFKIIEKPISIGQAASLLKSIGFV